MSEGLCDEVITQRYHAGIVPPGLYWETPAWKALVRARVPLVRAVQPDLRDARGEIARIRAGGYDGICSYESNATVLDTGFLRLFRSLRRAGRGRGGDHG